MSRPTRQKAPPLQETGWRSSGSASASSLRQSKLGDGCPRGGFIQRKKVEGPGIAVAGCESGANEQTGHSSPSRHPDKNFGSFTGPCEEEIGTAGLCGNVVLAHPGKQRRRRRELVPTCRAVGIHVGSRLEVAQWPAVKFHVPTLVSKASIAPFAKYNNARLSRSGRTDLLHHPRIIKTASFSYATRQQKCSNTQRHATPKHHAPTPRCPWNKITKNTVRLQQPRWFSRVRGRRLPPRKRKGMARGLAPRPAYSVWTSTTPDTALMAPAICGETLNLPGSFISTSVSRSSIRTSDTSPSAPPAAAEADFFC
jgi:hypothetical protein